jgi:hypothetical protein
VLRKTPCVDTADRAMSSIIQAVAEHMAANPDVALFAKVRLIDQPVRSAASQLPYLSFRLWAALASVQQLPNAPHHNAAHCLHALQLPTKPQVLSNEVEEEYYPEQQRQRQHYLRVIARTLPLGSPPPAGPRPGAAPPSPRRQAALALQRRLGEPLRAGEVARVVGAWCSSRSEEEAVEAVGAAERWAAAHCGGGVHTPMTLCSALLAWELEQHEVRVCSCVWGGDDD